MVKSDSLRCDGCGQPASPEHIARRLKRLEWATRFRPVHIQVLLLGAVASERDDEFIYSPNGEFVGEAPEFLRVAGISSDSRSKEAVQAEFQRAGLFVTHVLECPIEPPANGDSALNSLLERRIPSVLARIRRSLKPKKLVLISRALDPFATQFAAESAGCEVILQGGRSFDLATGEKGALSQTLQATLAVRRPA